MAKMFEHYREFDYQEDYERLAWEREKQINEEWELEESKKVKNLENGNNSNGLYKGEGVERQAHLLR